MAAAAESSSAAWVQDTGVAKLADVGLAKVFSHTRAMSKDTDYASGAISTYAWAAPECGPTATLPWHLLRAHERAGQLYRASDHGVCQAYTQLHALQEPASCDCVTAAT